ncbi:hypothetical protein HMPREF0880_02342 [Yokenella regensburgei ATCC 43003]|nr:hypothetical protein HMPREF0880_02342 [Yokenella regensburgei ATCC 43003]
MLIVLRLKIRCWSSTLYINQFIVINTSSFFKRPDPTIRVIFYQEFFRTLIY